MNGRINAAKTVYVTLGTITTNKLPRREQHAKTSNNFEELLYV